MILEEVTEETDVWKCLEEDFNDPTKRYWTSLQFRETLRESVGEISLEDVRCFLAYKATPVTCANCCFVYSSTLYGTNQCLTHISVSHIGNHSFLET